MGTEKEDISQKTIPQPKHVNIEQSGGIKQCENDGNNKQEH